jgi:DNA repair exonuclease SbcCD ATPase subunit
MNNNELDVNQHEHALQLHQRIITSGTLAAQNIWDMANALKDMRDGKLYKELGYDRFDDYCENEVGMKRSNAYRYISIAENMKAENVPTLGQIGFSKISLLASLSEEKQTELTENIDLESVSVRQLKEEINKLKGEKLVIEHEREKLSARIAAEAEKAEEAEQTLKKTKQELKSAWDGITRQQQKTNEAFIEKSKLEKQIIELNDNLNGASQELEFAEKRLEEEIEQNARLEKENRELKNRPVEVAVEDRTDEYEKKLAAALDDERRKNDAQTMELTKDFHEKVKTIREEYEQKLKAAAEAAAKPSETAPAAAPAPAYDKDKETFKIYLVSAHDAIKRLISAAKDHDAVYSDKVKQLLIKSIELLEVQQ